MLTRNARRDEEQNDLMCTYMGFSGSLAYVEEPLRRYYKLKNKKLHVSFVGQSPVFSRPR
jgi:hypothetical protein